MRDYDIGHMIDVLTDHIAQVLGVAGAGVSLGDEAGVLQFITAADETTSRVEQAKISAGEGPCHDGYLWGEPTGADDLKE